MALTEVLVFTELAHPRLHYALAHLFQGASISTTSDKVAWLKAGGSKLWYDHSAPPAKSLHIVPTKAEIWLGDNGHVPAVPQVVMTQWQDMVVPIIYPTGGHLGYDAVAAVFYMLSRAAEHGADVPLDKLGRYTGRPELKRLYKNAVPVVDLWRLQCAWVLEQLATPAQLSVPIVNGEAATPALSISMDIDNWFAFKGKPASLQLLGVTRDLLKLGPAPVLQRLSTMVSGNDPFDPVKSFEAIGNKPLTAFVLAAQERSALDKNLPLSTLPLNDTAKEHPEVSWAWHPSTAGGSAAEMGNLTIWQQELDNLKAKLPILKPSSRFHYLKFRPEVHYPALLQLGIREDHSLLFANMAGWRAGTSKPFRWFSLAENEEKPLTIHPAVTMDTRLAERFYKSPDAAANWLAETYLIPNKKLGLQVHLVIHNESLSQYGPWRGFHTFLAAIKMWL